MRIPDEEEFVIGSTAEPGKIGKPIFTDFIDAPEVKEIAERLLGGPLSHLDDGELLIDFRWKHRGGSSGGNAVHGKCVKLNGIPKHYAGGAHFMVWLAADWNAGYSEHQIEALVYHELLHIDRLEDEDKDGNPTVTYRTRGHDAEVFFDELARYGAWSANRERLIQVVRQLPLPIAVTA